VALPKWAAGIQQGIGAGVSERLGGKRILFIVNQRAAYRHSSAAEEAADNGLLSPTLATGIAKVKGAKAKGTRMGCMRREPTA
jgi:hypothetical protein